MVMIVKDHEKQALGFISVTWLPWHPRRPAEDLSSVPGAPRVHARPAFRAGGPLAVSWRASPRLPPHAGARKARTLALGVHCSEQ
jgi:hypothetical protein